MCALRIRVYTCMHAHTHIQIHGYVCTHTYTQGWALYEGLLVALLRFMEPYLRVAELSTAMRAMYTGTLRLLLVRVCMYVCVCSACECVCVRSCMCVYMCF